MASLLFRPLAGDDRMQKKGPGGRSMEEIAARFIKPNDRLTSFERLEIYNRQYWFRVLDCFYDDYPGLRAILGEKKFGKLARAYLEACPSISFTLRNLGSRLVDFLKKNPAWTAPHQDLALDMARFEWAQIVAFDSASQPVLSPEKLQQVRPSRLKLRLQPYLQLLELHYAVDEFLLANKQQDALRHEASNAFDSAPKARKSRKLALPRREKAPIHLAVHRFANALYYKRLEPQAYRLLLALGDRWPLTRACDRVLKDVVNDGADWPKKIQDWFAMWTRLGWFCQPGKS
jgi:hypothetical protein